MKSASFPDKIIFFLFFLLLSSTYLCSQQTEELGYVVKFDGKWVDQKHSARHSKFLERTDVIYADSEIVPSGPYDRNKQSIQIRLSDRSEISFSCKEPTLCDAFLPLPKTPSVPSGFLQVVLHLLTRESPPPVQLSARGATVDDIVLKNDSGSLSLGPALRYTDPGEYLVSLCKLQPNDMANCKTATWKERIAVDGVRTRPVRVNNLASGLYQLRLSDPANALAESDAYVLIAQEPQFDRISNEFEKALHDSEGWRDTDANFSALIRLYLKYLARQVEQ